MRPSAAGRASLRRVRLLFATAIFYSVMANRLYLVAFDLRSPGDYGSLKARLTTMGARQILDNVSALLASESAPEIKQILKSLLDDGDRILVVELGRDWASRHALFPVGELMDPHSPAKRSDA